MYVPILTFFIKKANAHGYKGHKSRTDFLLVLNKKIPLSFTLRSYLWVLVCFVPFFRIKLHIVRLIYTAVDPACNLSRGNVTDYTSYMDLPRLSIGI